MIKKFIYLIAKKLNNRSRLWYLRRTGVHIGNDCRLYSAEFGSEPYLVSLGNHVTVSRDALFITHDGGVWILRNLDATIDYIRPIIVEDNVFIGARAIILPGVIIGRDSIVAAGAIVTKSVPSGSIVGGTPARILSTREEYKRKLDLGNAIKQYSSHDKRQVLLDIWGRTPSERKQRLLQESH